MYIFNFIVFWKKNYRPFLLNFIYIDWKIPTAWLKWFCPWVLNSIHAAHGDGYGGEHEHRGHAKELWREQSISQSLTRRERRTKEDVDRDKTPLKHIRFRSSIRWGIPVRCYLVAANARLIRNLRKGYMGLIIDVWLLGEVAADTCNVQLVINN